MTRWAFVVCLVLEACGSGPQLRWHRPSTSAEQFYKDRYECRMQVVAASPVSAAPPAPRPAVSRRPLVLSDVYDPANPQVLSLQLQGSLLADCLRSRGYDLVPPP